MLKKNENVEVDRRFNFFKYKKYIQIINAQIIKSHKGLKKGVKD